MLSHHAAATYEINFKNIVDPPFSNWKLWKYSCYTSMFQIMWFWFGLKCARTELAGTCSHCIAAADQCPVQCCMPLPWNEVRCVFCGRTFAVSFAKTGPNMGKIIPRLHPRILQCEPKCLTLITTRRRLAREQKKCFSSSSEDGSRKR